MEYLDGCSTTMRCVARRVATMEGGLVWFGGGFTAGMLFQTGGLAYNIYLLYMCETEVAILLLMLASDMIRMVSWFIEESL